MDKDVSNRLAKAGASFGRLWTRVWGEQGITLGTKRQVHKAVPALWLWNLADIQKKLDQFHLRCLRKVMGISWEDRVSNTELLQSQHAMHWGTHHETKAAGGLTYASDGRRASWRWSSSLTYPPVRVALDTHWRGSKMAWNKKLNWIPSLDEKPSPQSPAPREWPSTRALKAF